MIDDRMLRYENAMKVAKTFLQPAEVFLDEPESVQAEPEITYEQHLARSANRFPCYQKYAGRSKDYYNEAGLSLWLRGYRAKNKHKRVKTA